MCRVLRRRNLPERYLRDEEADEQSWKHGRPLGAMEKFDSQMTSETMFVALARSADVFGLSVMVPHPATSAHSTPMLTHSFHIGP